MLRHRLYPAYPRQRNCTSKLTTRIPITVCPLSYPFPFAFTSTHNPSLQIPQTSHRHFTSLARRLGLIFAHSYFHHREAFEQAEAESSLHARFLALTSKFDLVPAEFLVIPPRLNLNDGNDRRDISVQLPRLLAAAVDPQSIQDGEQLRDQGDSTRDGDWDRGNEGPVQVWVGAGTRGRKAKVPLDLAPIVLTSTGGTEQTRWCSAMLSMRWRIWQRLSEQYWNGGTFYPWEAWAANTVQARRGCESWGSPW
jgi:hypothetical protein